MGLVVSLDSLVPVVALALDRVVGFPDPVVRRIGHPVVWIGALIDLLDRRGNRPAWPGWARRAAGAGAVAVVVAVAGGAGVALAAASAEIPGGWLLEAGLAATLLAQKSLLDHVAAVARALPAGGAADTADLTAARRAVALIVGRDPTRLDAAGIARAAIESLAENLSDGVVAPALWLVIGGLPGICVYKAINTADSMIGHRTARHAAFGWAAARLDDLVNLPAARLTGLIAVAASLPDGTAAARAAWTTMWRDARHHRSPNAGWPEAAFAGGLGLALAGPRVYPDHRVDDPWIGRGRRSADAADLGRALALARRCLLVAMALALTVALAG